MKSNLRSVVGSLALLAVAGTAAYGQGLRQPPANNAGNRNTPVQTQSSTGQTTAGQPQAGAVNDNPLGLGPNTPTVQIPIVTPQAAVQAGYAQTARVQPFPALNPAEQNYLDQVLAVWEQRTAVVNQFQCEFKRWQFDPTKHATAPYTIAAGILKYRKPDQGLYRVDKLVSIANANEANPQYLEDPRNPFGEFWICDGRWVHSMDRNQKKAIRHELPPDQRGEGIYLSPLPFLFGVKASEIKDRYFVRTVAPQPGNDDVWIEAWPKRPDDAGNYSRVQIVLDRADRLPKTMIVYMPNWSSEAKHREVYEFENRKTMDKLLDKMQQLVDPREFISTKLGSDWEVIEEPWIDAREPQVANQSQVLNPAAPGTQQINR